MAEQSAIMKVVDLFQGAERNIFIARYSLIEEKEQTCARLSITAAEYESTLTNCLRKLRRLPPQEIAAATAV
jgi:hypothetical protein